MGVVLRQAWNESQWTVLLRYLTISTNVRRYQTHHRWQLFLSGRQRTGALCVTQSNWVKMWFSRFPILTGSTEAQVIWGGIAKCLLIAYFIRNISAKKISKSIHVYQSYSKPKVGHFLRHNVHATDWNRTSSAAAHDLPSSEILTRNHIQKPIEFFDLLLV